MIYLVIGAGLILLFLIVYNLFSLILGKTLGFIVIIGLIVLGIYGYLLKK